MTPLEKVEAEVSHLCDKWRNETHNWAWPYTGALIRAVEKRCAERIRAAIPDDDCRCGGCDSCVQIAQARADAALIGPEAIE